MTERRIGIVLWLMVGLPLLIQPEGDAWRLAAWLAAFLLFGACFFFGQALAFLAIESLAVMAMVLVRCNGFEGTLLVLVAMQLGARMTTRRGIAWIVAQ